MITIDIKTEFNHLPQITSEMSAMLGKIVEKIAGDLEAGVKDQMAAKKSGRIYRKGSLYNIKTRKAMEYRTHQASAPGEAPAIDYGQLVNSIQIKAETPLTYIVSTNVSYAMPLEYGSRKMAARPVWRPEAEKQRKIFVEAITQYLQQIK